MASTPDPTNEPTARQLLVSWANDQDNWARALAGEVLATRKEVSTEALDEIYELFLAEKKLSAAPIDPVDRLTDTGDDLEEGEALRLLALREVRGVNALLADQKIDFNPHLTVFFGENAAGKTGYVRVLKCLAAVRSAEPILPDIRDRREGSTPQALVAYTLADEDHEYAWNNEEGVQPFTRVSIFDSNSVLLHVDEALAYSYTPSDLALFPLVHQAIEGVKSRLATACEEARPSGNPFITAFTEGTEVYSRIETLGASTDLTELARLADVPEADASSLDQLRGEVDALRPQAMATALQAAKGDQALYKAILSCARTARGFKWARYSAVVADVDAARKHQEAVGQEAFANLELPGVLTESWKAFIEAGEEYIETIGDGDYPRPADPCIYCRQPLEAAAIDLLRKYRDYCTNTARRHVKSAEKELAELAQQIEAIDLDRLARDLEQRTSTRDDEPQPVFTEAQRMVELLTPIKSQMAQGRVVSSADAMPVLDEVDALASEAAARNRKLIDSLTKEKDEREKLHAVKSTQLQSLEARLQLKKRLADIEHHVERTKWANKAAELLSYRFPRLLRSLTAISKQASEQLLNADFDRRFREECDALKAPSVELDFPGRKGQAARRKTLVSDHRLSEILSEGEQKAIALADFLAEASLRQGSAPIVFDDPVTSLDYKRLKHVVDRAVGLSADHQVIVFTHNIWFAAELLAKATGCSYFEISSHAGTPGHVTAGTHPQWNSISRLRGRINSIIQDAGAATGEARGALIESAYDRLRAWCEVVIEKEILGGVSQRYQAHVAVTQLGKIKIHRLEEAIATLQPLYEKACRCMSGHSQPAETLNVRPSLEELREDWKKARDARDRYRA